MNDAPEVVEDERPSSYELEVALEQFQWLCQLRDTAAVEGFSQSDVEFIIGTMSDDDEPAAGLEYFKPNSFMAERSMVNYQIGNEGVLHAIVRGIQKLFKIFWDYVIRVKNWIKRQFMDEKMMADRLRKAAAALDTVMDYRPRYLALAGDNASIIEAAIDVHHNLILSDTRGKYFEYSEMGRQTLIATDPIAVRSLGTASAAILTDIRDVLTLTMAYVKGSGEEPPVIDPNESNYELIRVDGNSYSVSIPELRDIERELHNPPKMTYDKDPAVKGVLSRKASKHEYHLIEYMQMVVDYEELERKVKDVSFKVDERCDQQLVTRAIAGITAAVDCMTDLGTVIYKYNKLNYNHLKARYNAARQDLVIIRDSLKAIDDEAVIRKLKDLDTALAKAVKSQMA